MPRLCSGLAPLLAAFLLACPEPVPEGGASNPMTPAAGPGTQPISTPGATPGGAPSNVAGSSPGAGAAGSAPTAGTFGGAVPESERNPKYSQEQLADGATIKGTLNCTGCAGQILVRVLPPPPEQPGGGAGEGLILLTNKAFPSAGPFEIKVPRDRDKVVLQIVDDADKDGQPSAGERMGLPTSGPVVVKDGLEGVELTVGVFPEMPARDASGNTLSPGSTAGALPATPATTPGQADGAPPTTGGTGAPSAPASGAPSPTPGGAPGGAPTTPGQ